MSLEDGRREAVRNENKRNRGSNGRSGKKLFMIPVRADDRSRADKRGRTMRNLTDGAVCFCLMCLMGVKCFSDGQPEEGR